ncbi:MAG: hypothetical protein A2928_02025 [Candidatus Taylorbacteria bacterium RIFCSPLOWO2_01_FULL_45_15b]|uniref:Uncharacterized protein n=1 Tax=Candidatus Taylorbacteria bacterium RIFCSPLOWO2_01_FULL_45_15b TaxID=1802319 RepID=A0A1G2N912_9BACT|nr:MAG: hypothetical protein A2928_02025 [Candidatus Taylorbacteria bacterium RIFCSPLOWO2_01_FULL_45_15b]
MAKNKEKIPPRFGEGFSSRILAGKPSSVPILLTEGGAKLITPTEASEFVRLSESCPDARKARSERSILYCLRQTKLAIIIYLGL